MFVIYSFEIQGSSYGFRVASYGLQVPRFRGICYSSRNAKRVTRNPHIKEPLANRERIFYTYPCLNYFGNDYWKRVLCYGWQTGYER